MKNKTLISIALLSFVLLLSFKNINQTNHCGNTGAIGTVVYSILENDKFKSVNGECWTLLDGKELKSNTALYKLLDIRGKFFLPNADGMFIRSVDTNLNDSIGDPDASKRINKIGSYQKDMFKKHEHNYFAGSKNFTERGAGVKPYRVFPKWQKTTSDEGVGGVETRPKNINLYTYIKVDDKCGCDK